MKKNPRSTYNRMGQTPTASERRKSGKYKSYPGDRQVSGMSEYGTNDISVTVDSRGKPVGYGRTIDKKIR